MDVTAGAPETPTMIRLSGVGKTYADGTVAVHELDLDVRRGELVVLVGPSGCGKSTTLKMINRLIEPTTGTIEIDGEDVTRQDPVKLRRGIGYVIQQVGLFPHQKIVTNVMTVPLLYGESKATARERAHELMTLVGLDPATYADRYPHQLSGGQRQRVGRGPGAGRGPAGAADGRAVRRGRPGRAGAAAGRVPAAAARARQDRRAGHPRHRRGGADGRPGRGVRDRRPAGAVRHPGRAARPAGRRLRGRLRRLDPRAAPARRDPDRPRPPRAARRGQRRRPRRPPSTSTRRWRRRWPCCCATTGPMVGVKQGAQFVGVLTPNGVHRALRASLRELR